MHFIAGIAGTALTGAAQPVWIDANGQLGTLPTGVTGSGSGNSLIPQLQQDVRDLQQQVRDQQATNKALSDRLARLEAQIAAKGK